MINGISKYIATKRGNRKGLLLAKYFCEGEKVYFGVGYSLCNTKRDKFDKDRADVIAFGRAYANAYGKVLEVPQSIYGDYITFYDRASRYFKGAEGGPIGFREDSEYDYRKVSEV